MNSSVMGDGSAALLASFGREGIGASLRLIQKFFILEVHDLCPALWGWLIGVAWSSLGLGLGLKKGGFCFWIVWSWGSRVEALRGSVMTC
jgi:hypothetical protein